MTAIWTYGLKRDVLFAGLFLLPVAWALVTRRLAIHAGLLLAALAIVLLAIVTPAKVAGA